MFYIWPILWVKDNKIRRTLYNLLLTFKNGYQNLDTQVYISSNKNTEDLVSASEVRNLPISINLKRKRAARKDNSNNIKLKMNLSKKFIKWSKNKREVIANSVK